MITGYRKSIDTFDQPTIKNLRLPNTFFLVRNYALFDQGFVLWTEISLLS